MIDLVTKWIVIGPWILWATWEIALLVMRGRGLEVGTISMVAKGLSYGGLAALAYFAAGMTTHWFVTWRRPVWQTPLPGVAFWLLGVAYLVTDLVWPTPHGGTGWWLWLRYPAVVAGIGALAGWGLFPQGSPNWNLP
jgi:hypothetical protein